MKRWKFEPESVPLRWTCSRFFCASFSSSRSLNTHLSSCRHKTHKHRHHQTLEPSQDLNALSTQFIIFSTIFTQKPIWSWLLGGSPSFFPLLWDRRLAPSYSPRGRPCASTAPGGVWKDSVFDYNTHNAPTVAEYKWVLRSVCENSFFFLRASKRLALFNEYKWLNPQCWRWISLPEQHLGCLCCV